MGSPEKASDSGREVKSVCVPMSTTTGAQCKFGGSTSISPLSIAAMKSVIVLNNELSMTVPHSIVYLELVLPGKIQLL